MHDGAGAPTKDSNIGTADLFTRLVQVHQKQRWFLKEIARKERRSEVARRLGVLALLLLGARRRALRSVAARGHHRNSRDVVEGNGRGERRQVARPRLRYRLEGRSELDQGRLAERRAEEADPERDAESETRRNLHDG